MGAKSGLSEPPLGTPVRPKPYRKIISDVDGKIKTWSKQTGELGQYHPSLKILRLKELPKGDFVAIGDSLRDVIILRNGGKMKAELGRNVKISLPKAFKISKEQTKSLAVKGGRTDITDDEFK